MAQSPFAFTPSTGLRDTTSYPTVPASEADARNQIQTGMDQLRDYVNNSVNPAIDSINNAKGAANGIATLDASGSIPASQLTNVSTKPVFQHVSYWIG